MQTSSRQFQNLLERTSRQLWANFFRVVYPSCCASCYQEIDPVVNRILSADPIPPGVNDHPAAPSTGPENTRHLIHESNDAFLDWRAQHWCRSCWKQVQQNYPFRCGRCGAGLARSSPFPQACFYCREQRLRFDRATATGNYEGLLSELVLKMKNQKDDSLAVQLGNLLGYHLLEQGWRDFDWVLPVPIFWSRRLIRGFQATEILTERVARITSLRVHSGIVQAIRRTAKQGTLSSTGRKSNVREAFSVKAGAPVKNKKLLLIDDVMTTGATSSEIARILKLQGASEVSVAVVARATGIG
jgi:competence protein ComFC